MSLQNRMDQLRQLKLAGMLSGLEHQLAHLEYTSLAFEQRLAHLVDAEISQRESQRFKRLMRYAKLKVHAEPEAIDYRSNRGLDRAVMADLLTCAWIERRQNLILTGQTGRMVALQGGRYGSVPIDEVVSTKKVVDVDRYYDTGRLRPKYDALAHAPLMVLGGSA